ncbi:hypothetical protein SCHIN_v1c11580 [Spiroplasma chinense]|uniref:Lipoprotein n=1 Tax=Spiroplasma chinense TaxID=216932 RepID=A0A5B9Y5N8_9MOLU|nr:hypothetical protein [Spiroplasma chinense]QEH62351.1 hypothetical protein SCHIN_v1c11580 [Spiroplasma chinense]
MKKLLKLTLSLTALTSTATSVVACKTTSEGSSISLPEFNSIKIFDTGAQVKYKIWNEFLNNRIYLTLDDYEVYLQTQNEKILLKDDYVIQPEDTLFIKILDKSVNRYRDMSFVVKDNRKKLDKLKITLDRELTVKEVFEKVSKTITDLAPMAIFKTDYEVLIDGKNYEEYDSSYIVEEYSHVEIKALEFSQILKGSINLEVILPRFNISLLYLELNSFSLYDEVLSEINNKLSYWEGNAEISITRDGKKIEFDSNYIVEQNDKFVIKSIEGNKVLKGELQATIVKRRVNFANLYLTLTLGKKTSDSLQALANKMNAYFEKEKIGITVSEKDLQITGLKNDTYITKDSTNVYCSYINNGLTSNVNARVSIIDVSLGELSLSSGFIWSDYETLIQEIETTIKGNFPDFEMDREYEITNKKDEKITADYTPDFGEKGQDYLILKTLTSSKYIIEGKKCQL